MNIVKKGKKIKSFSPFNSVYGSINFMLERITRFCLGGLLIAALLILPLKLVYLLSKLTEMKTDFGARFAISPG